MKTRLQEFEQIPLENPYRDIVIPCTLSQIFYENSSNFVFQSSFRQIKQVDSTENFSVKLYIYWIYSLLYIRIEYKISFLMKTSFRVKTNGVWHKMLHKHYGYERQTFTLIAVGFVACISCITQCCVLSDMQRVKAEFRSSFASYFVARVSEFGFLGIRLTRTCNFCCTLLATCQSQDEHWTPNNYVFEHEEYWLSSNFGLPVFIPILVT